MGQKSNIWVEIKGTPCPDDFYHITDSGDKEGNFRLKHNSLMKTTRYCIFHIDSIYTLWYCH